MILGESYFALPLPFARRVAAITGTDETEAFRLYTPWYSFVAYDNDVGSDRWWRKFDPAHPGWRAFVAAVREGADPVDDVYERAVASLPPDYGAHGRAFAYDWWADSRTVRLHFANNTPGGLALRDDAVPQRIAELRDVCAEVAAQHPEAEYVRGASWLYHLPKYRRLFPPEYVAALEPIGYEHQFLALWGQFLNRHGEVKPELRDAFLARVAAATTMDALNDCFPHQVLATTCDIAHFYRHYGVAPPETQG